MEAYTRESLHSVFLPALVSFDTSSISNAQNSRTAVTNQGRPNMPYAEGVQPHIAPFGIHSDSRARTRLRQLHIAFMAQRVSLQHQRQITSSSIIDRPRHLCVSGPGELLRAVGKVSAKDRQQCCGECNKTRIDSIGLCMEFAPVHLS